MSRRTRISAAGALSAAASFVLAAPAFGVLAVSQVDAPDPVAEGQNVTYTITVTNTGATEEGVQLTALTTKPGDLSPVPNPYQSLTTTVGTCTLDPPQSGASRGGRCLLGDLANGASVQVTGVVRADFSMDHIATLFACVDEFCFERATDTETTTVTHPTPQFSGSQKIKLKGFPSTCATATFKVKAKAKASKVKSLTASLSGPRDDLGKPLGDFDPPKKISKKKGKKVKPKVKAGELAAGFYELDFLAQRKGAPSLKRTATFESAEAPFRQLSVVARALRLSVGLVPDDVEVAVELHVDLASVLEGDLDLVVALLVADLGLGDLAAAGVLERRGACPVEGVAADRRLGVVAAGWRRRGRCHPRRSPRPPRRRSGTWNVSSSVASWSRYRDRRCWRGAMRGR